MFAKSVKNSASHSVIFCIRVSGANVVANVEMCYLEVREYRRFPQTFYLEGEL